MYDHRKVLEEKTISENLIYKISISLDESTVYLTVNYMEGNFSIEKTYKNNIFSLESMDKEIDSFNTEEKVRKYLNLGDS